MKGPDNFFQQTHQGEPVKKEQPEASKTVAEALAKMHKVPHVAKAIEEAAKRKKVEDINKGIKNVPGAGVPKRVMRPVGSERTLGLQGKRNKGATPHHSDTPQPQVIQESDGGWRVIAE